MEYYSRHLESQIIEASKYFKAILVLGARQVGKSTMLSHIFPDTKAIVFDPIQDIYRAKEDPELFLQSFPAPLILDEVQYVPELLPALKRKMDLSENKGQYFLTGSQNFNVLRSVAESMAGRVAIFHLDNFSLAEMLKKGNQSGWLSEYLENPDTLHEKGRVIQPPFHLMELLFRGSFPATLEFPISQIPRYFRSYLETYVDRDIRLQEDIRQISEFDRFLGILASLTAQEINASHLGREIGISPHTAKRWVDLLNFTYQWLELFPYHGNTIKRLSGKKKGYFKDSGFACYLQRIESPDSLAINPRLGAIFETWVVNSIHQQFATLSVPPNAYHWRTAAGAEVDLILEKGGVLYPIEIKCKTQLSRMDLTGLKAFRETYPQNEIAIGLVIYAGSEVYFLDKNSLAIPWNII